MVKTAEELANAFVKIIGEDNKSDEVLEFMENLSDTVNASKQTNSEYNKDKFDALEKEWRERYMKRFMGKVEGTDNDTDNAKEREQEKDEINEDITIDELFKEVR